MKIKLLLKMRGLPRINMVSKSQPFRLRRSLILSLGLVVFGSSLLMSVAAQQTAEMVPVSRISDSGTTQVDTRYRIGPGDVLSILVRKAPELSGFARVDQRGMIRIPMIEADVPAACKTESELAQEIVTLYLEYKKTPNVQVFVTEFQSRPVSVIGAVDKPGQFRLQRQVRLLELLSFAGGQTDKAGRVIDVIHTGGPNICKSDAVAGAAAPGPEGLAVYKLDETLKGKEGSNPFILPGDIISLPEADQVWVIGHVIQPRAISLKDKPITISRAIAMAGGAARDGKTSKVRIVRQTANGEGRQEIFVDLGAIQKQKAEDIALLPNDIVEVGSSTSKTILSILSGAVPATLANGVVRAIP